MTENLDQFLAGYAPKAPAPPPERQPAPVDTVDEFLAGYAPDRPLPLPGHPGVATRGVPGKGVMNPVVVPLDAQGAPLEPLRGVTDQTPPGILNAAIRASETIQKRANAGYEHALGAEDYGWGPENTKILQDLGLAPTYAEGGENPLHYVAGMFTIGLPSLLDRLMREANALFTTAAGVVGGVEEVVVGTPPAQVPASEQLINEFMEFYFTQVMARGGIGLLHENVPNPIGTKRARVDPLVPPAEVPTPLGHPPGFPERAAPSADAGLDEMRKVLSENPDFRKTEPELATVTGLNGKQAELDFSLPPRPADVMHPEISGFSTLVPENSDLPVIHSTDGFVLRARPSTVEATPLPYQDQLLPVPHDVFDAGGKQVGLLYGLLDGDHTQFRITQTSGLGNASVASIVHQIGAMYPGVERVTGVQIVGHRLAKGEIAAPIVELRPGSPEVVKGQGLVTDESGGIRETKKRRSELETLIAADIGGEQSKYQAAYAALPEYEKHAVDMIRDFASTDWIERNYAERGILRKQAMEFYYYEGKNRGLTETEIKRAEDLAFDPLLQRQKERTLRDAAGVVKAQLGKGDAVKQAIAAVKRGQQAVFEAVQAKINHTLVLETPRVSAPRRFHGSNDIIPDGKLYEDYYSSENIYGQGFYTTDDHNQMYMGAGEAVENHGNVLPITKGYAGEPTLKADGTHTLPTIYEAIPHPYTALYDMERPIPTSVHVLAKQDELLDNVLKKRDSEGKQIEGLGFTGNMRELHDELRIAANSMDAPLAEVQTSFELIRAHLEKLGYRGYRHVGGLITGRDAHNVHIYWKPHEDIVIRPLLQQPAELAGSGLTLTTRSRWMRVPKEKGSEEPMGPSLLKDESGGVDEDRARRMLLPHVFRNTEQLPLPFPTQGPQPSTMTALGIVRAVQAKVPFREDLFDKAGNINLRNVTHEGDVPAILKAVSEANGHFLDQRRGVVSLQDQIETAKLMGLSIDEFKRRGIGAAYSAEELTYFRVMLVRSSVEIQDLAETILKGADTTENWAMFNDLVARHSITQRGVMGAIAEAGRATGSMRIMATEFGGAVELGKMIDEIPGGRQRLRLIANYARNAKTSAQMGNIVRKAVRPDFWDKTQEWFINALLASLRTNEINFISNISRLAMSAYEKPLTIAIHKALNLGKRDDTRLYWGEMSGQTGAALTGIRDGFISAGRQLITEQPAGRFQVGAPQHAPAIGNPAYTTNRAARLLGRVVRTPANFMGAGDVVFRSIAGTTNLRAMAYRAAMEEARDTFKRRGLSGDVLDQALGGDATVEAIAKRADELANNPTPAMLKLASERARSTVFQDPLGPLGQRLVAGLMRAKPLRLVVPFVTTTTNIIKATGERTPLGLLSPRILKELAGKGVNSETQAAAIAKMASGSAVTSMLLWWAAQDNLTGSMPLDPRVAKERYALGWRPNSLVIGDWYVNTAMFGVLSNMMTIAADAHQFWYDAGKMENAGEAFDLTTDSLLSAGQEILDNSSLRAMTELVTVITANDKRGREKFIANLATSFAPAFVRQATLAADPYVRKQQTMFDDFKAPLPGFRETLEPRVDWKGQPIEATKRIFDAVFGTDPGTWQRVVSSLSSPAIVSKLTTDPIELTMARLGLYARPALPQIADVKLTPAQGTEYATLAGQGAYQRLKMEGVGTEAFRALPPKIQIRIITGAMSAAKHFAQQTMFARHKDIFDAAMQEKANMAVETPDDFFDK